MIESLLSAFIAHLWQSTLVIGVVWLTALALRGNRARVRCWLWRAASLKFLIPFWWLTWLGAQFEWRSAPALAQPAATFLMEQILAPPVVAVMASAPGAQPTVWWPWVLASVWVVGFVGVMFWWWRQWQLVKAALRLATPIQLGSASDRTEFTVMSSPWSFEPGVIGIWRPVLLLPEGLADRLTAGQLNALIAHERCHMRCHDNLSAAVHMLVEALFWFHPLVWWIEARLIDERERACDEDVLRTGNDPADYAEGILTVCKFTLRAPLACVAGVTGSNLKNRIKDIMSKRIVTELTLARKAVLAVAGATAVAAPILLGMIDASSVLAQSSSDPLFSSTARFEVASIKPIKECAVVGSAPTPGGLTMCGALAFFIQASYDTYTKEQGFKPGVMPAWTANIEGAPGWLNSELYQIEAKAPGNPPYIVMAGPMFQALLEDRLKLKTHLETRNVPVYELTVAKGGSKLQRLDTDCVPFDPMKAADGPNVPGQALPVPCTGLKIGTGTLDLSQMTMSEFSQYLGRNIVRRPVIDKVGMAGRFNFHLEFAPDENTPLLRRSDSDTGPSIFTAMQEQLGLKLEPATGPHEFLVIDSVQRPSEN